MNPISDFFARNIIFVFFLYGLAFFVMGIALALASRRTSEFRFAQAIRPLAAFGVFHGIHEWLEMFQKIAAQRGAYAPTTIQEVTRLGLLTASFLMLSNFGVTLLSTERTSRWRLCLVPAGMAGLWLSSTLVVMLAFRPSSEQAIALADVLSRYSLGVPGALLGTWALMTQQRTFREHSMPQFGRDLVWCATALFLYGVIGQAFVRKTVLVPSTVINDVFFLRSFGIPVQLFRGTMAAILALFMVRALNAFELESQRRLDAANEEKLNVQREALRAERRISRGMEQLNEELRLAMQELSLLLSLANLLATPMSLPDRLHSVLEKIVSSLHFPDAGMILLIRQQTVALDIWTSMGFGQQEQYAWAQDLGQQCVARSIPLCRRVDGAVAEFPLEQTPNHDQSQDVVNPVTMVSLPLAVREHVIGSIVLSKTQVEDKDLSLEEAQLLMGMVQQLGLSIENARLYQQAQEREKLLGELLHQAVGTQEAERQRIARELHDATGQSLTAIALGLRGVESILESNPALAVEQINELKSFTTNALGELRQLISDLRPSQLDDLGLVAALRWYVQEFEKRYAVQTGFVIRGEQVRLSSEYETVLFRITQEALTNVAKHANASRATVTLETQPAQISVCIEDDGRGFDPQEALRGDTPYTGWGLLGIQERTALLGGQYEIESEPGSGARVCVRVPLVREVTNAQDTTIVG